MAGRRLRFAPVSLLMHSRLEPVRRAVGAHSPARLALKGAADRALGRADEARGTLAAVDRLASRQARLSVLLLGIYVERPGLLPDAVGAARASRHDIVVALGSMGSQPAGALSDVTVATGLRGGKFANANAVAAAAPAQPRPPRWTLLIDSDVTLPAGFFDRFLALVEAFDLAIAQPALTLRSFHSHGITRRRPGSVVRETRFVEIGPLTAFRDDAAALLFPFDADVGMGWGLDLHWPAIAAQHGLRMGIVDATPIGHEEAPFGTNYSTADAERAAAAWLDGRPSVPRAEAHQMVATHRRVPR
jgi:hypothetical protein